MKLEISHFLQTVLVSDRIQLYSGFLKRHKDIVIITDHHIISIEAYGCPFVGQYFSSTLS